MTSNENAANLAITELDNSGLVEQYAEMTKWYHYDPVVSDRPSAFDKHELYAEIISRMEGKNRVSRDLLNHYETMVKWSHYDPHGLPRPNRKSEHELRSDVLNRMRNRAVPKNGYRP